MNPLIPIYWLVVALPLGWGVSQAVIKSQPLFNNVGAVAAPVAPVVATPPPAIATPPASTATGTPAS